MFAAKKLLDVLPNGRCQPVPTLEAGRSQGWLAPRIVNTLMERGSPLLVRAGYFINPKLMHLPSSCEHVVSWKAAFANQLI